MKNSHAYKCEIFCRVITHFSYLVHWLILKLLFTSKNETTDCSAICREKCNFGDRENRINDFCYGQSLKMKLCPAAVANSSTTAGFEHDRRHCCHCKNSKVLRLDMDAGQRLCGPGPERNNISPNCPWEWFITATVFWRDSGYSPLHYWQTPF